MPQSLLGPVNIVQGDTAKFVIQFRSSGELTVPSSGNLTVAYTNTSGASQTDTVSLTQVGSHFTGTWPSTSAALGLATWTLTSAGSTSAQQVGKLRIITP